MTISSLLRMFISFDKNIRNLSGRGFIMAKKGLSFILFIFLFASLAQAQTAEVTVSLNEKFFEVLLDTLLKADRPLEFPLAGNNPDSKFQIPDFVAASFAEGQGAKGNVENEQCRETLRLQREINPPLIGCVDFSGVAETRIDLEFDRQRQALIGRAHVLNVNLTGTGGIGGSVLARLVQGSLDQKINPIEILRIDKVSLVVPLQNSGNLQMKAVGLRHQVNNGSLNVHISYRFE
jgi:hypothetical protein